MPLATVWVRLLPSVPKVVLCLEKGTHLTLVWLDPSRQCPQRVLEEAGTRVYGLEVYSTSPR